MLKARTYDVSPEMLGLTWSRLLWLAVARAVLYLLTGLLISSILGRGWPVSVGSALILSFTDLLVSLFNRIWAPSQLRLTDEYIEEIGGPIIRREQLIAVEEMSGKGPAGIEVVGRRESPWLPKYRIFVPATVPGFNEIRLTLMAWDASADRCQKFSLR